MNHKILFILKDLQTKNLDFRIIIKKIMLIEHNKSNNGS